MIIYFISFCLSILESEFFSNEVTHLYESYINTIIPIPCRYFIKNSIFLSIKDIGSASIDFRHRTSIELLVMECMFNNCSTQGNGGALHFDCNRNGTIALYKLCITFCYTLNVDSYGQFALISIASNKNCLINLISYSKCSPFHQSYNIYSSLYISYGKQNISNTNSSYNHASFHSSICIVSPTNLSLYLSAFTYNNVKTYYNLCFQSSSSISRFYIEFCNIINNNSPDTVGGVIYSDGGFVFNDCIFMYNSDYLFSHYTGNKCYVNRGYIFHHNNAYVINPNGYQSYLVFSGEIRNNLITPTYTIVYFSTHFCHGDFMNGQELTPCITLPPIPTPAQTIPNCQSFDNSLKLFSTFISIIYLSIFQITK